MSETNRQSIAARVIYSYILISCIVISAIPIAAQVRRAKSTPVNQPAAVKQVKQNVPACSGAWTGMIIYSRTQAASNHKVVQRVSGRGEDTTDWNLNYNYQAKVAVLESPEKNGTSIGRASINHSLTSVETIVATEKNSCDRGKSWREMSCSSTSRNETTGSAGGLEVNVNVGVNADDTYAVSVGIPPIKGKVTGSVSGTCTGQCTQKEFKNSSLPATETSIDGNSMTSDTQRLNPGDPNRISGSSSKTWQNVTETLTWRLQKMRRSVAAC